MEKQFEVEGSTGNLYTVTCSMDPSNFWINCTCEAGQHAVLCKHVLGLLKDNSEIATILAASPQNAAYVKYYEAIDAAERAKKEAANRKKALTRQILTKK